MIEIRPRQEKCVKAYTKKIHGTEKKDQIDFLYKMYNIALEHFYQQFCGVNYMVAVKKWRILRNEFRKEFKNSVLYTTYHLRSWQWVGAIQQACMNINSMWSNLGNRLKKKVQNNDDFTDEERAYLNYVFSAREIWQAVLKHGEQTYYLAHLNNKNLKYLEFRNALNNDQLQRLQSYIRRATYQYKPYPHAHESTTMLLDKVSYRIFDKNNKTYLSIATSIPRQRLIFELTSKYCYQKTSNIQLIWNKSKKRLEIHKNIKAKTNKNQHWQKKDCGVDKGLHNILSNDDGQEFGINYSKTANQEAQRIMDRNKQRNPYIQSKRVYKRQIHNLRRKLNESMSKQRRIKVISRLRRDEHQLKCLLNHNIGNKIYTRQNDHGRAKNKSLIGHAVRQMYLTEKPTRLAKEDLTFTKDKQKTKIKWKVKLNNRLNSWYKGYLDDRLTYQGKYYHVKLQDVNPAYTSQFCPICGAKILKRKGKHKEIAVCPNCGEFNANTGAAKNIKDLLYDQEITVYTPYKEVKKIRENRYKQKSKNKKVIENSKK